MSQRTVVGLTPSLPWPLDRWAWWTAPVRAERLAALRIGVAVALLLDIFGFYLPWAGDLFGQGSLSGPGTFAAQPGLLTAIPPAPWSLLSGIDSPGAWQAILLLWAVAAVLLLLGVWPQLAAGVAWFIGGSVHYVNPFVFNAGDAVRNIMLFYLMLSPCGAVWSLRRRAQPDAVYVAPWPLRLLFVQMMVIYVINGLSKLGSQWQAGDTIYYVTSGITWTRWSPLDFHMPYPLTQFITYATVAWELTFPIMVLWPRTRTLTILLAVLFHLGTGTALKIGVFPLYMLCLYLPLLPWERWLSPREPGPAAVADA